MELCIAMEMFNIQSNTEASTILNVASARDDITLNFVIRLK